MSEHTANSQDSAQFDWQSSPLAADTLSTAATEIRATRKGFCPECGAQVNSRMDSCPACGENLVYTHKPVRCMHCHTTASSELVICPGCGRELREAPPKLITLGAPAVLALLLVALLVMQWPKISPLAWARDNWTRGVVLVEDLSASLEPEMVIVMTPIVPDDANPATVLIGPDAGVAVSDTQAVALAAEATEPEVLAASVVQEMPFGVGGPQPEKDAQPAAAAVAPSAASSVTLDAAPATLPAEAPPATPTPLPTVAMPTPTLVPTQAPDGQPAEAVAAKSASAAAVDEQSPTPTPTWTAVIAASSEGSAPVGGVAQVAALAAAETALPTPTQAATPAPTATATPVVYQVRAGDTLVSIAATYGVSVDDLMTANEISGQDVYVIQQGQMLIVPVPTPEPTPEVPLDAPMDAEVSVAGDLAGARVEAPQLLVPTEDALVGCATGGTLIWQRAQFVKDSDKYLLHLGFVSGRSDSGQDEITWILAQSSPVTVTEWQLDTNLCDLAPDAYDHEWRWWVEVVEAANGTGPATVSVSPPSEMRSFRWQ